MINVIGLNKNYNKKEILKNVDFNIKSGEVAVIYGINGAGKTTLIKCLIDLIDFEGKVELIPDDKSQIGVYLGHEMLIEKLKVNEYLSLAGKLKDLSDKEVSVRITELSERLNFNKELDQFISKLSLGTKTKVLLASAILNNPKLLILDEPFTGLDLIILDEVVSLLKDLKENGCTIFISSHQVQILDSITDRILILKDSKIVYNQLLSDIEQSHLNNKSELIISYLK